MKPSAAATKVEWFLSNLDLQIEERRLKKEGRRTVTYFDTASVRAALLGMEDFLTETRNFDLATFNRKFSLVHALASAFWLGPIKMLVPHQNEFRTQANLDFGLHPFDSDPRPLTNEFLFALGIDQEIVNSRNLKALRDEDRVRYVRTNAGSTEKLFKVIQFLRGSWRVKLVDWLDTGQLIMIDEDIDMAPLLADTTFIRLRKILDKTRSRLRDNNFVDALAMADFARKLRRFNRHDGIALPVYFSPEGSIEKLIRREGLLSRFSYSGASGEQVGAIRGPDYFIFRAIFDPPPEIAKSAQQEAMSSASDDELAALREQVALVLDARTDLERALNEKTILGDRTLRALINDLLDLCFFERVWLPFSPAELEDVEEKLQEAAETMRSEEYRAAADKALLLAKAEIDDKTRNYRELEDLWRHLGTASGELRRRGGRSQIVRAEEASRPDLDPFLHLGLLRFSLPKTAHGFIKTSIDALLSGGEAERAAKLAILQRYRSARLRENTPAVGLMELSGVLWCLDLDEELIALLEQSIVRTPVLSLELMLVASYFRASKKVGQGNLLLQDLVARHEPTSSRAKKGQLFLGLGYLYFHLILCLRREKAKVRDETIAHYFELAISYSRSAWETIEEEPESVYALNCYLYYMAERGDRTYAAAMEKAQEELQAWSGLRGIWQYRFDDTLARYYYFRARLAEDEAAWRHAMDNSMVFIEKAWLAALGDREVLKFRTKLAGSFQTGFHANKDLARSSDHV